MTDEPEIQIIKLPDVLGDDWRAERDRQGQESRTRYKARLVEVLGHWSADPTEQAEAVVDALFAVREKTSGEVCRCSCHPRLPDSNLHDYGFGCRRQKSASEHRADFGEWMADIDAFWTSPEGRLITAANHAKEDQLAAWLLDQPDVVVTSHGGQAPEQWGGRIDGHSFYFRERHDQWRIELDLRPTGGVYLAWNGQGDLDNDASFEPREVEQGDVIADGTISAAGYGETPVQRIEFIVETVRTHLRRQNCQVHATRRDDLEILFGAPLRWCPNCGAKL